MGVTRRYCRDAIDDRDAGGMRPAEFKEVMDMVAKRNPVKADGPAKTPPSTPPQGEGNDWRWKKGTCWQRWRSRKTRLRG